MLYTSFIIGLPTFLTTVTGTFVVPINSSSTALTLSSGSSRFFYQDDDLSIHEVSTLISPANGIYADVSLVPGNIVRENTPLACLVWPASAEDFGVVFLFFISAGNQLYQWTWLDGTGWKAGTLNFHDVYVAPGTTFLYTIASSATDSETARIEYLNPAGNVCEVLATGGHWSEECY